MTSAAAYALWIPAVNVLSVAVEPGDAVATGDTVLMLESMKMEIPVLE